MGYFSDSWRNWVGLFWAATAIPLVLDPSNPIWDESGWWEEQFDAPYAPLEPSGGNYYFTPNFWAGRGSETVGAGVPELHQNFPLLLGAPVVPKAQIWSSKKICPAPPLSDLHFQFTLTDTLFTFLLAIVERCNFWLCFSPSETNSAETPLRAVSCLGHLSLT